MMLIGISCREEILIIRNVHISLLATPAGLDGPGRCLFLRSSSRVDSSSIAFKPAGVAAQPRPRILAIILVVMDSSAG